MDVGNQAIGPVADSESLKLEAGTVAANCEIRLQLTQGVVVLVNVEKLGKGRVDHQAEEEPAVTVEVVRKVDREAE